MPRYRLNVDFDNSIEEFLYNGTGSYTFTVPASPNFDSTRYLVYLPAVLYLKDASKLPAITSYTRVEGRIPSTGEFRTIAAAQWDTLLLKDAIEFPAASAGATLTMTGYYTVGSTIAPDGFVDVTENQTIAGVKTFSSTIIGSISGSSTGIIETGSGGSLIKTKIIALPTWDMDSVANINVTHGISTGFIVGLTCIIVSDDSANRIKLDYQGADSGWIIHNASNVSLYRAASGLFDSTSFDSTASSRGWLIIDYV